MNEQKLVTMANQISTFFESMPDHAEAIAGITNHIRATWDPRMRQGLKHHIETCGDRQLSPLIKEALPKILAD
jgi:formate dehydrogenase subunit delta